MRDPESGMSALTVWPPEAEIRKSTQKRSFGYEVASYIAPIVNPPRSSGRCICSDSAIARHSDSKERNNAHLGALSCNNLV
jgi:hypothetical protein